METLILALVFLWLGFVGAISFMESWLKFRANGVTLTIGLSIGRKVFGALNKVEITLSVGIIAIIILGKPSLSSLFYALLGTGMCMVLLQTIWFLPMLDRRVSLLLEGKKPEKSRLHVLYVSSEMIKALCLVVFGLLLL
jgi:hypothetical protein